MSNLPAISKLKYETGSVFTNKKSGMFVEVTGFATEAGSLNGKYQGKVWYEKSRAIKSNVITEHLLDGMELVFIDKTAKKQSEIKIDLKKRNVRYKISYTVKADGGRVTHASTIIELSNMSELTRALNRMVCRFPERRINVVTIVDENEYYQGLVRLLPQEIVKQKFLTNTRTRLLAHAKYREKREVAMKF